MTLKSIEEKYIKFTIKDVKVRRDAECDNGL
jgi:hypothetical protein